MQNIIAKLIWKITAYYHGGSLFTKGNGLLPYLLDTCLQDVTTNAAPNSNSRRAEAVKDQGGPAAAPLQNIIVVPPQRQLTASQQNVGNFIDLEAKESRAGGSEDEGSDMGGFIASDEHHSEEEENDVESNKMDESRGRLLFLPSNSDLLLIIIISK